jgi:hypothetical protein
LVSTDSLDIAELDIFDVLGWWKIHETQYPYVVVMAKKYLAIQSANTASERVFSQLKLVERRHTNFKTERISDNAMVRVNKTYLKPRSNDDNSSTESTPQSEIKD